jgi:hypothetical protein
MITADEAREIAIKQGTEVRERIIESPIYERINQEIKGQALLGKFSVNIQIQEEGIEALGHSDIVVSELLNLLKTKGYKRCLGYTYRDGILDFNVSWDDSNWRF